MMGIIHLAVLNAFMRGDHKRVTWGDGDFSGEIKIPSSYAYFLPL